MQLIVYSLILFIIFFLLQVFFIIKKEKFINNINDKTYLHFSIKIVVSLIISLIIGIISFYIFGIFILLGLNEGR